MKKLTKMINECGDETIITPKNARIAAIVLCVIFVAVSFIFEDTSKTLKGVILGGAVAQLLFRQHELTVWKSVKSTNPQSVTVSNYMVRLIIKGLTVFVAIQNPDVGIIGCILGLLSVPYGIYALAFADWILQRKIGKEV